MAVFIFMIAAPLDELKTDNERKIERKGKMEKKKSFDTLKGEILQKEHEKRGPLEYTNAFLIHF